MNKIPSFTANHNKLLRDIYVSRQDVLGFEVITTLDIRMKEPSREPVLHIGVLHTIKHLAATYLRNDAQWKDKVVYWGPMGCLTGSYLIIHGDLKSSDIADLIMRTFSFIVDYEGKTPGVQPRGCGSYLLYDPPMAKLELCRFLEEVLLSIEDKNLVYPE